MIDIILISIRQCIVAAPSTIGAKQLVRNRGNYITIPEVIEDVCSLKPWLGEQRIHLLKTYSL